MLSDEHNAATKTHIVLECNIYIYIYRERQKEREKETERQRERQRETGRDTNIIVLGTLKAYVNMGYRVKGRNMYLTAKAGVHRRWFTKYNLSVEAGVRPPPSY